MRLKVAIPLSILTLISSIVITMANKVNTGAEFDLPGLNQKVNQHDEKLNNHEARITNVENDVKDVQATTSTPPSTNRQNVPKVVTPDPELAATPAVPPEQEEAPLVTISGYEKVDEGDNTKCILSYSDGSRHTFMHKLVTQQPGTPVLVQVNGVCNDSLIGKEKKETYTGY